MFSVGRPGSVFIVICFYILSLVGRFSSCSLTTHEICWTTTSSAPALRDKSEKRGAANSGSIFVVRCNNSCLPPRLWPPVPACRATGIHISGRDTFGLAEVMAVSAEGDKFPDGFPRRGERLRPAEAWPSLPAISPFPGLGSSPAPPRPALRGGRGTGWAKPHPPGHQFCLSRPAF